MAGCTVLAPDERPSESTVQGLSVQPSHKQALAAFVTSSDLLISAREVVLPLSKRKILRAKILDQATQEMRRIAVENGKTTDALQAFADESALRRAKYAAMQPAAFAQLAGQNNKVLVWLRTPSLNAQTSLPDVALKAKLAQDKGPFLAGLAKMAGVKLERNMIGLPIVELSASKAAILALAQRTDVARIDPAGKGRVERMSRTVDQEHIRWSMLTWPGLQWPITGEVKVAMVEECHPDQALRAHDPAGGRVNYLPNTVDEGGVGSCLSNDEARAHANMTHSILYGHRDYDPPEQGKFGMLEGLSRPVSSVALLTVSDVIVAMDELLSRPPGTASDAAPDIISISAWVSPDAEKSMGYVSGVDPNLKALDWMTVMKASHPLVVMAAGNDGYEPPHLSDDPVEYWGACHVLRWNQGQCSSSEGSEVQGPSAPLTACMNGRDDDNDGDVDCKDASCANNFACENRHYVIAKIYNGLAVGSSSTGPLGFSGIDPQTDRAGHPEEKGGGASAVEAKLRAAHSSWRAMPTPHDDLRLPHVVANGDGPQGADNLGQANNVGGLYWYGYQQSGDHNVGTSFAAPQVAGYAAYAYRAAAAQFPTDRLKALEAARAIVIASARHNVLIYYYPGWPATAPTDDWKNTFAGERTISANIATGPA